MPKDALAQRYVSFIGSIILLMRIGGEVRPDDSGGVAFEKVEKL